LFGLYKLLAAIRVLSLIVYVSFGGGIWLFEGRIGFQVGLSGWWTRTMICESDVEIEVMWGESGVEHVLNCGCSIKGGRKPRGMDWK